MREEGFVAGTDDVRLTVEILVPSSQVGRIIGKGGQNVRELQRVTGSIIKLPEQGASPPSQDEETTVHIIGPFFSVQVCIFPYSNIAFTEYRIFREITSKFVKNERARYTFERYER
jgi:predicted PilT family ATPase